MAIMPNKNRIVDMPKPQQSGSLELYNFGNPAIPTNGDPWLSPPAPSLEQGAFHQLRRAGVPRLLVVWYYRFFYQLGIEQILCHRDISYIID